MENVEFEIESLSIKIYTNIPDKEKQIVDFTRNMLIADSTSGNDIILTDLPFFTTEVEYPVYLLNKLDYQERINFFFNANKFIEILKQYYNKDDELLNSTSTENTEDEANNSYYDKRERRTRKNIMTMLEVLFPTKFPVINDIHASYDFLKGKQSTRALWFNPFQTHYFSYLKINGKTYTIKRTVWLNDMLNHPVYRKMLVEYRKIRKWADEQLYSKDSKFNKPEEQLNENKNKIQAELDDIKQIIEKLNKIIGSSNATSGFTALANIIKDFNMNDDKSFNDLFEADWIKGIDDKKQLITKVPPTEEVTNDRKKIIKKVDTLKKLHTNMQQINKVIKEVNEYFTKNLNDVNKKEVAVRKFQVAMNEYKDPFRKSSNIYLQHLIDGLFKDDSTAMQYYKLLDIIYKKYIQGNTLEPSEIKILNGGSNVEPKLVNVGISYINIGDSKKPTREVYFMIDLIEGEVNNDNFSSIYCPFMGDYLGNQLEYLISEMRTSNKNMWAVDSNRKMFSLKKIEASITNNYSQKMLSASDSVPDKNLGPNQLNSNHTSQTNGPTPVDNFMTYIMKNADDVDEVINSLKNKYVDDSYIGSLHSSKILEQIRDMKDNPFATELYGIIGLWNKDMLTKNRTVIDNLVKLSHSISAKNDIIAREKESFATKNDPTGKTLIKLNKTEELNNLLSNIAKKVLSHEETKREKVSGGTRKHKTHAVIKKKYTRRQR